MALLVASLALLEGLYLVAGHRIVTAAYNAHQRTFLNNLIPGRGHSLAEYFTAADAWYAAVRVWALVIGTVLVLGTVADPLMAKTYSAMVAATGRMARRPAVFITTIGVASLLLLTAVGQLVLQNFPNSGDEYCYVYQAQTFARGRLGNPPHPLQEFFELLHVANRSGTLVTSFPPGWPLLLAGALLVRVPVWIINPLIGAGTLAVLFLLGRRIYDDEVAVAAVLTMMLSSFFIFTSASYFGHTLAGLLVLLFVYFALDAVDEDRAVYGALAGTCLGWAVTTRYYPPLLCAVPVALFAFQKRPRPFRAIAGCAAAGLPFVIFLLVYNATLTGHPLVLTLTGVEPEGEWFPADFPLRGTELLLGRLGRLLIWTPPVLLFVYLAYLNGSLRDRRTRIVALVFVCLVAGLLPFVGRGGNQYGPRYFYEAFPFLVLVAVAGLFRGPYEAKTVGERRLFYLFAVSLVASLPLFVHHARTERRVILERTDLYRQVEARGVRDAIVFIQTRVGAERSMSPLDLTRNGPDITGNVLYAIDLGDQNRRLMDYYSGRSYYTYRYDVPSKTGILTCIGPLPGGR